MDCCTPNDSVFDVPTCAKSEDVCIASDDEDELDWNCGDDPWADDESTLRRRGARPPMQANWWKILGDTNYFWTLAVQSRRYPASGILLRTPRGITPASSNAFR